MSDPDTDVARREALHRPAPPPILNPVPPAYRCPYCDDAQWCSYGCTQAGFQSLPFNNHFSRMVLFQSS
jgi:hypothetical protein